MARFDVYKNPDGGGYLLDVQADLLSQLNTRMVVPLMPVSSAPEAARGLNPIFRIGGKDHVLVTQFMAAVPTTVLRTPVTNIEAQRNEIVAAIDLLMQGF